MIGRLGLITALLVSLGCAVAQAAPPSPLPVSHISGGAVTLEAGTGRVVTLESAAANVFVADPKVAEVRPASATSLFLFGVGAGHTTVAAMDANGRVISQYEITVQPSGFGAREAQASIARLVPGSRVQVRAQSKGLLLTGAVPSPADAAQAVAIAKGYLGENMSVNNELTIEAPIQVTLHVRIAEMSRQVVRNLGVDWSALGTIGSIAGTPALTLNANGNLLSCALGAASGQGVCAGANFNGIIDALAKDNLAQVLAEPNLTVMSGQSASFQVGGEYPIPVSQQNNQVTISYKNFGVMLTFVPTVFSNGRINLHVRPEVSELSQQNSVSLSTSGTTLIVPSLTVRRAETTVELGSGQSFAIAGLLQQSTLDNGKGLPGLGDTPILGALFRTSGFDRTEKELVIVVTPYIVRPVNNAANLRLPTDGYKPASDIERLLLMRQVAERVPPVPVRIPGDAGFIVQ
ncbi:MAG: type II and III secretion system protein family protein [Acetobacteraceae bacterium]